VPHTAFLATVCMVKKVAAKAVLALQLMSRETAQLETDRDDFLALQSELISLKAQLAAREKAEQIARERAVKFALKAQAKKEASLRADAVSEALQTRARANIDVINTAVTLAVSVALKNHNFSTAQTQGPLLEENNEPNATSSFGAEIVEEVDNIPTHVCSEEFKEQPELQNGKDELRSSVTSKVELDAGSFELSANTVEPSCADQLPLEASFGAHDGVSSTGKPFESSPERHQDATQPLDKNVGKRLY